MRGASLSGILLCVSSVALGDDPDVASSEDNAAALFATFDENMAAGDFPEAVDAAKIVVSELLADEADDLAIANALTGLAEAQLSSGDILAAAQNFEGAILRIQGAEDMLAEPLVRPLTGLARALRSVDEYSGAEAAFHRAAHISRVNRGPMNLEQCDILAEIVDLHTDLGNFKEARAVHNRLLHLYRRNLGETDDKVIEAWRRNGELLSLAGEHHDAQELYTLAADIIRVADGQNSLRQIPLLLDLSESYLAHAVADRFTRIEMARAELERVIVITEDNPHSTPRQKAEAYLRMGDFMQRFGEQNSAIFNYRQAWAYLPDKESKSAAFNTPLLLNPSVLSTTSMDDDAGPDSTRTVTIVFDVTRHGTVDNQRIAEDQAQSRASRKALMVARKLRYRPRFEDGDPVIAKDVVENVIVVTH